MSRTLPEASVAEIKSLAFVAPAVDSVCYVCVVFGEIFAAGAVGMCPLASFGPVERVGCEGGIPGEGCGIVFGAVGVRAVEDGGAKGGV